MIGCHRSCLSSFQANERSKRTQRTASGDLRTIRIPTTWHQPICGVYLLRMLWPALAILHTFFSRCEPHICQPVRAAKHWDVAQGPARKCCTRGKESIFAASLGWCHPIQWIMGTPAISIPTWNCWYIGIYRILDIEYIKLYFTIIVLSGRTSFCTHQPQSPQSSVCHWTHRPEAINGPFRTRNMGSSNPSFYTTERANLGGIRCFHVVPDSMSVIPCFWRGLIHRQALGWGRYWTAKSEFLPNRHSQLNKHPHVCVVWFR